MELKSFSQFLTSKKKNEIKMGGQPKKIVLTISRDLWHSFWIENFNLWFWPQTLNPNKMWSQSTISYKKNSTAAFFVVISFKLRNRFLYKDVSVFIWPFVLNLDLSANFLSGLSHFDFNHHRWQSPLSLSFVYYTFSSKFWWYTQPKNNVLPCWVMFVILCCWPVPIYCSPALKRSS